MEIKSYRDLEIWKKGIEIVEFIYSLTEKFPNGEKFGLISQMQQAAVSVPSNRAEGHTRQYTKEFKQFCFIALGSCAEIETLALISKNRGFITEESFNKLTEMLNHESRMIINLTKRLES